MESVTMLVNGKMQFIGWLNKQSNRTDALPARGSALGFYDAGANTTTRFNPLSVIGKGDLTRGLLMEWAQKNLH